MAKPNKTDKVKTPKVKKNEVIKEATTPEGAPKTCTGSFPSPRR